MAKKEAPISVKIKQQCRINNTTGDCVRVKIGKVISSGKDYRREDVFKLLAANKATVVEAKSQNTSKK